MKLPPEGTLTLTQRLAEFDIWITPALREIRDSEKFKSELERVAALFDALAETTNDFASLDSCSPIAITAGLQALVSEMSETDAISTLTDAASLLFLVTGKSDNNAKCQLPLHLRDAAKWQSYPALISRKNGRILASAPLPRVIKAEDYMALTGKLVQFPEEQELLLTEFVKFVLSDEKYVAQLWSIGKSYTSMKAFGHERSLLTPLVIFQVRGSVSASGGHAPENLVRSLFDEWGLVRGTEYNVTDVTLAADPSETNRVKKRGYDFVLPFSVPGLGQRIFIQAQFYAGDSGSVSHKNVDQTSTSRARVRVSRPNALFIEFVDGAGYFSSLNGDLKNLLSMPDTSSFFQLRSAPVRLRRSIQEIGFLTTLEIEHAIARTSGDRKKVESLLVSEGYSLNEVKRTIDSRLETETIETNGSKLEISDPRWELVRRYFLLDTIAKHGVIPEVNESAASGFLLVSGFGPLYGMKMTDAVASVMNGSVFSKEFASTSVFVSDLQWLEERRWVMSS